MSDEDEEFDRLEFEKRQAEAEELEKFLEDEVDDLEINDDEL